jgi:hypothetical protein
MMVRSGISKALSFGKGIPLFRSFGSTHVARLSKCGEVEVGDCGSFSFVIGMTLAFLVVFTLLLPWLVHWFGMDGNLFEHIARTSECVD